MNYYYLGAALPGISMDTKPPVSQDEFRGLAAEHLSSKDLQALSALENIWEQDATHPFVNEWRSRETALRNALVKARAAALKKDPESHLRDVDAYDSAADRAAAEALSRPNPLEKEKTLDNHRWTVLGEMAGYNTFSSEAILAYALKLSIALRWAQMDTDTGRAVADQVLTGKTEPGEANKPDFENNENSE